MLPAHLAKNIREQVLFYLQSTFDFADANDTRAFERFLTNENSGIFKGPWLDVNLPFAKEENQTDPPFSYTEKIFQPYIHQSQAWNRLTSYNKQPESTIITTGTGSGKTECFLYPILDHVLRAKQAGQKGIKAIILYPMNALAADQEKRFASTIFKTSVLKEAELRVGLYIGRHDASKGRKDMGLDHGITDHETMQANPPDILLTNYKMLDYLLMRPSDARLWQENEPGVLKYLVLDELHTYDGAQGTDVACLIRRLKARLGTEPGSLCCVGTSATLESGQWSDSDNNSMHVQQQVDAQELPAEKLLRFAERLFAESLSADAIVAETRIGISKLISPDRNKPDHPNINECSPDDGEDALDYAMRQVQIWGGPKYTGPKLVQKSDPETYKDQVEKWQLAVGDWLGKNEIFFKLLRFFVDAGANNELPVTWDSVVDYFSTETQASSREEAEQYLQSLLAIVNQARYDAGGINLPLLPIRLQLWIRELRRIGRVIDQSPAFAWLDDKQKNVTALPAFHCRSCGAAGWVGLIQEKDDRSMEDLNGGRTAHQLNSDYREIYNEFFGDEESHRSGPHIVLMVPAGGSGLERKQVDKSPQAEMFEQSPDTMRLFADSLVLAAGTEKCPLTESTKYVDVHYSKESIQNEDGNLVGDQRCPRCQDKQGTLLIGSQAATIASVSIDEMFGTKLNRDPKLLAFTDSVQDASHRAGFFSTRTYNFTFRTALRHCIENENGRLPIVGSARKIVDYLAQPLPGLPGTEKDAFATILPPDLAEHPDWQYYRQRSDAKLDPEFVEGLLERLEWQVIAEFGLEQFQGRTLEASGSATLAWNKQIIETVANEVLARVSPGIVPNPDSFTKEALTIWVYGLLHRFRLQGSVYHPYLKDLAAKGFWGKQPWGKTIPGRELHPLHGRNPPVLVSLHPDRYNLTVNPLYEERKNRPWVYEWTDRTLGLSKLNLNAASWGALLELFVKQALDAHLIKKVSGSKFDLYTIHPQVCSLTTDLQAMECSASGRQIIRPAEEAGIWAGTVSMEYRHPDGQYKPAVEWSKRQSYYQARYRKGAIRRVVAEEHTGLLKTQEREEIESRFNQPQIADDPNVLACTSTLEMGIDIGDLSVTMLCSVPPSASNYVQRIGRAGRSTGTSLIVSIINQSPHDLFFFGRPREMLRGTISPPGCWLDAAAVLSRQFLGFVLDTATKERIWTTMPRTSKDLWEQSRKDQSELTKVLVWLAQNERELKERFLQLFVLQEQTIRRFHNETSADIVTKAIKKLADSQRVRAGQYRNQIGVIQRKLPNTDDPLEVNELERELKLLQFKKINLERTPVLEILTNEGLLPNYAFPEKGVSFEGTVYGANNDSETDLQFNAVRPASSAIKELAPDNTYYMRRRRFEIQQLSVDSDSANVEDVAICGNCGYIHFEKTSSAEEVPEKCPQCLYENQDEHWIRESGQKRKLVQFSQSRAISSMEYYDSLSADRRDDRRKAFYQVARVFDSHSGESFDTIAEPEHPFGMEFMDSLVLRDLNTGYSQAPKEFNVTRRLKYAGGFKVCPHCGMVAAPKSRVSHRPSCKIRQSKDSQAQRGREVTPEEPEELILYRELKSEAVRILLPIVGDEHLQTLKAAVELGLRIKFKGEPANIYIAEQALPSPDLKKQLTRYYLVLMDAVPGGTGYLKALYYAKKDGLPGEGIIDVFKLAKTALEDCTCRRLQTENEEDPDGCYRCIRSYRSQYQSEKISRERAIHLLQDLIAAADRCREHEGLGEIGEDRFYDSVLERTFVEKLRSWVQQEGEAASWKRLQIDGKPGFRFKMRNQSFFWELQVQPTLGTRQGFPENLKPDFMLTPQERGLKPIAVFTDGYEYHVHPKNRLQVDCEKRNAIRSKGRHLVWSLTWPDVVDGDSDAILDYENLPTIQSQISKAGQLGRSGPDLTEALKNSFRSLLELIRKPNTEHWETVVGFYQLLRIGSAVRDGQQVTREYRSDRLYTYLSENKKPMYTADGHFIFADLPMNQEAGYFAKAVFLKERDQFDKQVNSGQAPEVTNFADSILFMNDELDFEEFDHLVMRAEWRKLLLMSNFLQFGRSMLVYTERQLINGDTIIYRPTTELTDEWEEIMDEALDELKPIVNVISSVVSIPTIGFPFPGDNEALEAEFAWPDKKFAILYGEQVHYANEWEALGWKTIDAQSILNDHNIFGETFGLPAK